MTIFELCTSIVTSTFNPNPDIAVELVNSLGLAEEEVTYGRKEKYGYKGIAHNGKRYMLRGGSSKADKSLYASPLHFAVVCENITMVKRLLAAGADPRIKCGAGVDCIELASANGSKHIAYLLVLGVWILAILISGTAVGIYIPSVMTKAQKRSRSNLFGLIRVKYAFIILTVLDWIGLGFYIYKVIAVPDSILRLIIELQKLPYDIVATSFAGIHFSLLAHVHHYTFKIASKIKDEQKKAQLNIKRRKNANSEHESVNEDSKIEEDESYLAVLGTWILVTLITGTMIGLYIPVVISRAQKKYNGALHGLINAKYALLGLGLLDWIGVFIYFYKAMLITDSRSILTLELKQLPYDIIATAVAGIHYAILTHIFHFTQQITSKIRDDKKKSQMNPKRRKSATNEEIVQEEIRSVEEVGSTAE
ncbi:hypothetical protein HK103_004830 [Boothiomyces macroporosus]|uniref:Uncharacterized protein n=1 Tax=Boothiomyces macroporosus TaxID=261099 RepID=A0AAD5UGU1_9FUNG|nr:hypothetical protein HK103_004830 [Boothiomyces macroporosus]